MYYNSKLLKGSFKIDPISDPNKQTVRVSEDGARVAAWIGSVDNMRTKLFDDASTLYEGFRRGARVSDNGECLGWRATNSEKDPGPYRWIRYNDVIERSESLARGFVSKGLEVGQNTFVGIYSKNRPEWIIAEQACYVYNMVLVPFYDTLGADGCCYIIKQTEMKLVVVDKSEKGEALLAKHNECRSLVTLVLIEKARESLVRKAAELEVAIVQFDDLIKEGRNLAASSPAPTPPTPDSLSTISYTSGTSGTPKGVMLTHGNVIADTTTILPFKYAVPEVTDTLFSFLPLAHMFERLLHATMYQVGGRVGFYRGDVKVLIDDIKELKPTVMAAVPRVLNRVYDKVMSTANESFVKRWALRVAYAVKKWQLQRGYVRNDSIWDEYVFKTIRESLGGRLHLMFTGSAPIGDEVITFLRCAIGCLVLEGYGQTECVACATLTMEGDHSVGHVGVPIPAVQVKLADVPEMQYRAVDGVGEVCFKGATVFKGYYKDEARTAEALDADGWLHTGDVGRWTPQGTLKLIDRKKNMFKLSQGEYITPEKLENVFARSRFVSQIYIHGESLKSCLVAVVIPDMDLLQMAADREMGVRGSPAELCENAAVKRAILDDIVAEGRNANLLTFELPKDIHLHPQPFSVENGLLTPTMKTKRVAVKERFQEKINQMYAALD